MRFNPATIAIRNGFLLALKLNIGKMSQKMKWAYATPKQAAAQRIPAQQVAAAKNAVAKVEKMFTKLGGKADNMRKAILHAKKGHLSGLGQLGVAPLAAGLAAAVPFIKMVMDVLKKSGLVKPGEQAELTPDGETTTQADRLLDTAETGVQVYQQASGGDEDSSNPSTAADSEYTPAEVMPEATGESGIDGLGSIFGSVGDFFRGNPGVALALTAGGAYLLYSAMHSDEAKPQTAGLGSTARGDPKTRRSPPKSRKPIPIIRVH